jgi:hypothetical protein
MLMLHLLTGQQGVGVIKTLADARTNLQVRQHGKLGSAHVL